MAKTQHPFIALGEKSKSVPYVFLPLHKSRVGSNLQVTQINRIIEFAGSIYCI